LAKVARCAFISYEKEKEKGLIKLPQASITVLFVSFSAAVSTNLHRSI